MSFTPFYIIKSVNLLSYVLMLLTLFLEDIMLTVVCILSEPRIGSQEWVVQRGEY